MMTMTIMRKRMTIRILLTMTDAVINGYGWDRNDTSDDDDDDDDGGGGGGGGGDGDDDEDDNDDDDDEKGDCNCMKMMKIM